MTFNVGDTVWVMFVKPIKAVVKGSGYYPEMRYIVEYDNGHTAEPVKEIVFTSEIAAWENEKALLEHKIRGIESEIEILKTKETENSQGAKRRE